MNLRNHGVHFTAYCFAEDSIIDTNDTELVPARVPAAGENFVRLALHFLDFPYENTADSIVFNNLFQHPNILGSLVGTVGPAQAT